MNLMEGIVVRMIVAFHFQFFIFNFQFTHASMCLRIVLDEQKVVLVAQVAYMLCIGAAAVEVDDEDGACAGCDGLLYQGVVDLQCLGIGLHEDGFQAVVGDGKDAGDVGVGRYDDLVALVQNSHLDVGTEDEAQGIKAVAAADGMAAADIAGIGLFEAAGLLATEIPSRACGTQHGLLNLCPVGGVHGL